MALPQWQRDRLLSIHARLNGLIDTSDELSCAVDNEHKEAVRLYVESWILPHVDVLLNPDKRNGRDDLGDNDARDAIRRRVKVECARLSVPFTSERIEDVRRSTFAALPEAREI